MLKLSGRWNDPIEEENKPAIYTPPILLSFAEIGGLCKLVKDTLQTLSQEDNNDGGGSEMSEEEEAIRNWLGQLAHDLYMVPQFARAFASNQDCVAMLLSIVQTHSLNTKTVSDLSLCYIAALHTFFSGCDFATKQLAMQHGMIDRLLLRLGEVQAEEPRRPSRSVQFQLSQQQQQPSKVTTNKVSFAEGFTIAKQQKTSMLLGSYSGAAAGADLATEALLASAATQQQNKQTKSLWKPGYGTGSGNQTTKQDQEREVHQSGKRAISIAIIKCLNLFLQTNNDADADEFWQSAYDCLEASCLLKVFFSYLFQTTNQAVMENVEMYTVLLELVCTLCRTKQVNRLIVLMDSNTYKPLNELVGSLLHLGLDDEDQQPVLRDFIVNSCRAVERVTQELSNATVAVAVESTEEEQVLVDDEINRYAELMQPELFKDVDMRDANTGAYALHHYHNEIEADSKLAGGSKTRQRRLNRELKALRTTLPLHFGSSIILRIDRQRPFVGKFIVFAPANTPYDSGAFLFDFFCSSEYPNEPPKVNLQTTGGANVRFNPNLYQNGKVCLSILGTWRGGANGSENWNADQSTLLQVLVSIQSAILGSEFPYFNEPTVETQWGSAEGELQKRIHMNGGYERLRVATVVHAMTAQITSPPVGFEESIRIHFTQKKDYILNTVCTAWLKEAASSDTKSHLLALEQAVQDLKKAFATCL